MASTRRSPCTSSPCGYAVGLFFVLTFIGGCTGSTASGVKIFRFQVMLLVVRQQIVHLAHRPMTYRKL